MKKQISIASLLFLIAAGAESKTLADYRADLKKAQTESQSTEKEFKQDVLDENLVAETPGAFETLGNYVASGAQAIDATIAGTVAAALLGGAGGLFLYKKPQVVGAAIAVTTSVAKSGWVFTKVYALQAAAKANEWGTQAATATFNAKEKAVSSGTAMANQAVGFVSSLYYSTSGNTITNEDPGMILVDSPVAGPTLVPSPAVASLAPRTSLLEWAGTTIKTTFGY